MIHFFLWYLSFSSFFFFLQVRCICVKRNCNDSCNRFAYFFLQQTTVDICLKDWHTSILVNCILSGSLFIPFFLLLSLFFFSFRLVQVPAKNLKKFNANIRWLIWHSVWYYNQGRQLLQFRSKFIFILNEKMIYACVQLIEIKKGLILGIKDYSNNINHL